MEDGAQVLTLVETAGAGPASPNPALFGATASGAGVGVGRSGAV